jgi:hypothetical protein
MQADSQFAKSLLRHRRGMFLHMVIMTVLTPPVPAMTALISWSCASMTSRERVKDYTFYGRLLAWHSSYFAAATDSAGGFKTSGEKVLELDGSHQVFDAFHCWVWTGRLKDPPASDAPIKDRYLPRKVLYDL